MLFFRSKPKNKRVLIFHIGSGVIISAFVLLDGANDSVPEIKSAAVAPMPLMSEPDTQHLISTMLRTLKKSAEGMVSEKIGAPDQIICFLGSPWYATQVRKVRMAKNAPFLVTEKIVRDMIKKESDLFDRELLAPTRETNSASVLVEREINRFELNGYQTDNPYGKRVSEIGISLVFSVSSEQLISQIREVISDSFHQKDITFHTFGYAGTLATRNLFLSHNEFMFIDVSNEITDIVLVKDGSYVDTASFPAGTNTILRALATQMRVTPQEVQTMLSLYSLNKLEATWQVKLERALDPILATWTRMFEETISKLSQEFALPHTIALFTDPHMYGIIRQGIMNESFAKMALAPKTFTVVPLQDMPWHSYVRQGAHIHPGAIITTLMVAQKYSSQS